MPKSSPSRPAPRPAKKAPRALASPPLRKYHLILADHERDLSATALSITPTGALVLLDADGSPGVTYAPGQWLMIELSRKDDRGESGGPAAAGEGDDQE